MTQEITDPIHALMAGSITLSVMRQLHKERYADITASALYRDQELLERFVTEARTLDISPGVVASDVRDGLERFLTDPSQVEQMIEALAEILWRVLGPDQGGTPPVIYKQAGAAMHLFILNLVNPNTLERLVQRPSND